MKGKVALVTGGLSGIGKATVLELVRRGLNVIVLDIQDEKAQQLAEECADLSGNFIYRKCNLFESNEIEESFKFVKDNYGHLDYALNNAGFGILSKNFAEVTEEEIDKLLLINVKAYMLCMKHEINSMRDNHFGRIVNTASGSGLVASKGMALYTACKHAVVGLTKAAALDYVRENITINAIAPGTIETELVVPIKEKNPEEYAMWSASNPIGRLGLPSEIARVVAFLFEDDSEFINGTVIPVDSGFVAGK
ncbi:2,5-dichloro-2,5-cyclohexadiene-1,4-diol dehydrogenase [bioreactor metagenome]|uniref:2,5-dichloro-2,5-cyclohexadiene-1,4-diol dehydrogenase n=1 Tax=bioreactor metagenome TaxID=1076179 RepID=A0A645DUX5_9ZZZZ